MLEGHGRFGRRWTDANCRHGRSRGSMEGNAFGWQPALALGCHCRVVGCPTSDDRLTCSFGKNAKDIQMYAARAYGMASIAPHEPMAWHA